MPSLIAEFLGGLRRLVQANAKLLVVEVRQTAGFVGRRALLLVPALALCAAGIVLLVAGAALLVGELLGEPWMGFALVGGLALLVGVGTILWVVSAIRAVDFRLPVTMNEIQKDLKWLKDRLKDE